ncbi:MAG: ComF family protein [Spiribacter sp.]|nr:ComF family protein [Spiribacter sp.]MDR9488830.1 ComF family protein [Spiribacter sp.]
MNSNDYVQWRSPRRFDGLLHAVFDGRCRFCTARSAPLAICPGCHEDLPWISAGCQQCGLPLASGALQCAACLSRPPPFQHGMALWHYAHGIDRLIKRFKLNEDYAAGRLLTQIAACGLRTRRWSCPAPLIPMPLHLARFTERGFNQSALIAKGLGTPVDSTLVRRIEHTPPQRGLEAAARRHNLSQAFALTRTPPAALTLVDDVITTGASLTALAECLRANGTRTIHVIALARAA